MDQILIKSQTAGNMFANMEQQEHEPNNMCEISSPNCMIKKRVSIVVGMQAMRNLHHCHNQKQNVVARRLSTLKG